MDYKGRLNKYIYTYAGYDGNEFSRDRVIYTYSWIDAFNQASFEISKVDAVSMRITKLIAYGAEELSDIDDDERMKKENMEYGQLYFHLLDFFKVDTSKVETWLDTKNPLFGDISPREMIRMGRIDKMMDIVERQLDANNQI